MIELLRDLIAHNGWANATMLNAVRLNDAAVADPEILELLDHILLANRFWLMTVAGLPFVMEEEARRSASFDELAERTRANQEQQAAWLAGATDADLGLHYVGGRAWAGRVGGQGLKPLFVGAHLAALKRCPDTNPR